MTARLAWRRFVRWLADDDLAREYLQGYIHGRAAAAAEEQRRRLVATTGQASQDLIDQLRREGKL
jgi:hypothetical protein